MIAFILFFALVLLAVSFGFCYVLELRNRAQARIIQQQEDEIRHLKQSLQIADLTRREMGRGSSDDYPIIPQ